MSRHIIHVYEFISHYMVNYLYGPSLKTHICQETGKHSHWVIAKAGGGDGELGFLTSSLNVLAARKLSQKVKLGCWTRIANREQKPSWETSYSRQQPGHCQESVPLVFLTVALARNLHISKFESLVIQVWKSDQLTASAATNLSLRRKWWNNFNSLMLWRGKKKHTHTHTTYS